MRGKDQNRQEDEKWMRQALSFAEQGKYHVSPNPLVGAVLVKHGEKIGEGFHEYFGGEHAEVRAIQNAEHEGHSVFESTLYVTLEPCSHSGKTPPCTDMILEKQIARVVFAASDPNPIAKGGGEVFAKRSGNHFWNTRKEAEAQNRYFSTIGNKNVLFLGKIALSQNGMVSNAVGKRPSFLEQKHSSTDITFVRNVMLFSWGLILFSRIIQNSQSDMRFRGKIHFVLFLIHSGNAQKMRIFYWIITS